MARQQKMKLHSSQDLLQVAQRGQPGSLGARSVMVHGVHQLASFHAVSTAKREQAWGQRCLINSSLMPARMPGVICSNAAAQVENLMWPGICANKAAGAHRVCLVVLDNSKAEITIAAVHTNTPRRNVCLVTACHQSHASAHCRMLQAQASHADAVPRAKHGGSNVPPQQPATSHCTPAAGRGSRPPSASRLPVLTRKKGGTPADQAGGGALVAGRQAASGGGASGASGGEALPDDGNQQPWSLQAPIVPASYQGCTVS